MKTTFTIVASFFFAALALTAPAAGKVIATFEEADSAEAWYSVNDGVMGGVSTGGCKLTDDGTLKFSGNLSLKNNGGFASIRTKSKPMDLSGTTAIAVEAKGDGRTYWVDLRGSRQMRASSYRAYLETTASEWKEIVIPIKDFKQQAFGRQFRGRPLNLKEVRSIGFTLADKKAGPFELEVKSVRAVAEGEAPAKPKAKAKAKGKAKEKKKRGTTIVDVAQEAGGFKSLLAAAGAADLAGALSGDGPLTVFAPTDDAFAKLPKGTVEELLKPENKEKLAGILKFHVISGRVSLAKALEAGEATTLQGAKIGVKFADGRVRIGPAALVKADIAASNGVIHVIDQVLLPPDTTAEPLGPQALIELAIDRGVPLFNSGNTAGCAAVYELACQALRVMPGVPKNSRADLANALEKIRAEESSREQAWILRKALDKTFARLDDDTK